MIMKIQVFDPAMCCSTGVCGPNVDPALARFAADLAWLQSEGVEVERFNLSQQPQAFLASAVVRRTLQSDGVESLPLILRGGEILFRGAYPTRRELAEAVGIEPGARKAVR
jgi:hypothetical protein